MAADSSGHAPSRRRPIIPRSGDLVGFRVVRYDPDLAEGLDLLGYIAFGFEPVFVPGKGWRIARNYTPENIRQTVRW